MFLCCRQSYKPALGYATILESRSPSALIPIINSIVKAEVFNALMNVKFIEAYLTQMIMTITLFVINTSL